MRTVVAAVVACLSLAGVSVAADVQASIKKDINIPAGGLGPALQTLSQERHVHIVYISEDVNELSTHGASGSLSIDEALHQLLKGTGLTYQYIDAETVSILPVAGAPAASETATGKTNRAGESLPSRLRIAQASSPSAVAEAGGTIQEIIVTAQKREERLQDVPVAVTVLKADTLVSQNVVQAKDYLLAVPGVQVNARSAGQTQINIRGITTGSGGNPLVGIVIDDIPFGSSTVYGFGASVIPDLDPSILSGIEVLRGPQGTLYGASSMGGLIKYNTQQPSLSQMSGAAQAGVSGTTAEGGTGYSLRGALNTPLVIDKFAVGVSGFYRRDPGFITDAGLGRENVDDMRSVGGRISLVGQLSDTLKVRVGALYQDQRSDASSQMDTDANGNPIYGDLEHRRLAGTDGFHSRIQFYDLILDQELGPVTLSSLTGYSQVKFSNSTDFTLRFGGLAADIFELDDPGVNLGSQVSTKKFTQELRATSNTSGPLGFIAGLYFGDEDSVLLQSWDAADSTTGGIIADTNLLGVVLDSSYREYAAYGSVTWQISPQLDLQVGGRYSRNEFRSGEVDTGPLGGDFAAAGLSKDDPFTFHVSPRYRFSDNLMAYVRIASGYRVGGSNAGVAADIPLQFTSDSTINYEIGLKGQSESGLLSGSVAAFYINWKDIQLQGTDPSTGFSFLVNSGTASSAGVEAALTVRPFAGLTVSSSATYNDAVLTQQLPENTFYGLDGDRLPYTARWTATLGSQYSLPISADSSAFFAGNLLYTGQRPGDFVTNSTLTRFDLPSFTTVDLRTGVEFDRWTLTLFLRNVGDSRGYLSARPQNSGNRPPLGVSVITPRTIGVSVSTRF